MGGEDRLSERADKHDVFASEKLRVALIENRVDRLANSSGGEIDENTVVKDGCDERLGDALATGRLDQRSQMSLRSSAASLSAPAPVVRPRTERDRAR